MQLTDANSNGTQCPGGSAAKMEPSAPATADASHEKSPKGQVRRPTRPEHVIAFEFLKIHYEEDVKAEIPVQKSDVYHDYEQYCTKNNYKPLVAADFGRILKSMFPNARDRRLGSRGSSKYCYVGVKRKSESNTKSASMNPYTAEDLANAYQTIVCEWASTVLSRKMSNLEELAKYLLRNRFVQTRSCAALTITASMKDSDGNIRELTDPLPVNKHRETQLKLQEKLREKLLNKQYSRAGSVDEPEMRSAQAGSHTGSTSSTPDPEGQMRLSAANMLQQQQHSCPGSAPGSQPGSSRTSPEHAAMSVSNSACTSPVFSDGQVVQKPLYPINYRNGYGSAAENGVGMQVGALTPMQCSSSVGSERNTPVHHQYTQQMSHPTAATTVTPQPHYQFDPRIQSCPTTPLPSFQQQRFDFSQHVVNRAPQNCISLPNSARNTPVQQEYYETTDNGYYSYPNSGDAQNMNQQQTQYSNQDNTNFQRSDFSRNNNSAFIPIKDGGMGPSNHNAAPENLVNYVHNAFSDMQHYQQHGRIDYSRGAGNTGSHNDSDELEINELFNIIDQGSSSGSHVEMLDQQKAAGDVGGGANNINRSRPMSAQGPVNYSCTAPRSEGPEGVSQPPPPPPPPQIPHAHTASQPNSLIYDLLTQGTNHGAAAAAAQQHRYRHHSGPQLGYAAAAAQRTSAAVSSSNNTSSVVDLNSPPSTPNGNFRPVLTPSRELRMHYGTGGDYSLSSQQSRQSPSALYPQIPQRVTATSSLVGTMSPPAQPLTKRKRQHSGEAAHLKHTTSAPSIHSHPAVHDSDYIARRNLGNQLSSPQINGGEGSPVGSVISR